MEVVPVPNSGAQHPVRVDANMDRDDLLQQIGKLENELREVHVRVGIIRFGTRARNTR